MDDTLSKGRPLLVELQTYERQGISIWLGDTPSSSSEVTEVLCLNESNVYMRDYVFRDGCLKELHFDQVRLDYY